MDNEYHRYMARNAFDKARKSAALSDLYNRLLGRSTELLSFEMVHKRVGGLQGRSGIRREIPLDAIVGSVGRYNDFNRDFLPRGAHDRERWARVKVAMENPVGLPPIEVYQLGEAYFVIDGNHRVSIARYQGAKTIMANVTEIMSRVGLTPDDSPKDLVCKAEHSSFLELTHLDDRVDEISFRVTETGNFEILREQVKIVQMLESEKTGKDVSMEDAAWTWYKDHYLPVIEVIREQNLLRGYPDRTETDLYIWLLEYREEIEAEFGWSLQLDSVAAEWNAKESEKDALRNSLQQFLDPEAATGAWRERQIAAARGTMFADIVVLLDEGEPFGDALDNALIIAAQEGAHVLGLLIRENEAIEKAELDRIKKEFEHRCAAAGIPGQLSVGVGPRNDILKARTRWADLVILPPAQADAGPMAYHQLLEQIHIPVLIARPMNTDRRRILIAYDDSKKSREALFLAAYLAALWGVDLSLIAVNEGNEETGVLETARRFLDSYALDARYISARGQVADAILQAAESEQAVAIVTGGYQAHTFGRHRSGNTLDSLMEQVTLPLLICR